MLHAKSMACGFTLGFAGELPLAPTDCAAVLDLEFHDRNRSGRGGSMHYLLFYDVVENYVEKRAPFRAAHLRYARAAEARGELILGGALANPVDGAVMVFQGSSPAVAESFAANDPYVLNGLIKHWQVREWVTVVGPLAAVQVTELPES
jgi:uncharacterized protein YciI